MNYKIIAALIVLVLQTVSYADTFVENIVETQLHNELVRKLNAHPEYNGVKKELLKSTDRSTKSLNAAKAKVLKQYLNQKETISKKIQNDLKRSKSINNILAENYRAKLGRVEKSFEAFSTIMSIAAGLLLVGFAIVVRKYSKHVQVKEDKYLTQTQALKKVFHDKNPLFRSLRIASKLNSTINYVVYDMHGSIKFATEGVGEIFNGNFNSRADWPALELANFKIKNIQGRNVRVTNYNPGAYYLVSKKELAKSHLRVCQIVEIPLIDNSSSIESKTLRLDVCNFMEDVFADLSSFKEENLIERVKLTQVGSVTSSQSESNLRDLVSQVYKTISALDSVKKSNYEIVLSRRNERVHLEIYCEGRLLSSDMNSGDLKMINENLGESAALSRMSGSFLVKNIRDIQGAKSKITLSFDEAGMRSIEESVFKMEFNELS